MAIHRSGFQDWDEGELVFARRNGRTGGGFPEAIEPGFARWRVGDGYPDLCEIPRGQHAAGDAARPGGIVGCESEWRSRERAARWGRHAGAAASPQRCEGGGGSGNSLRRALCQGDPRFAQRAEVGGTGGDRRMEHHRRRRSAVGAARRHGGSGETRAGGKRLRVACQAQRCRLLVGIAELAHRGSRIAGRRNHPAGRSDALRAVSDRAGLVACRSGDGLCQRQPQGVGIRRASGGSRG